MDGLRVCRDIPDLVVANATLLLPAPGIAVVFAMGSVFNPFLVSLAAGTGAAVGEMSGYAAGFSGQGVLGRHARL